MTSHPECVLKPVVGILHPWVGRNDLPVTTVTYVDVKEWKWACFEAKCDLSNQKDAVGVCLGMEKGWPAFSV